MLQAVLALRYIMLIGALGAALGAALMFFEGAAKLAGAIQTLVVDHGAGATVVVAAVLRATDAFLFGIVLVIFAYAITFGFVLNLPPEDRRRLPAWMRVEGVGELKHTLIEVILVYLVVDFATNVAEAGTHLSWDHLILPFAVVLIAGASRLLTAGQADPNGAHRDAADRQA